MVLSASLCSVPGIIHKNAGSRKGKLGLLFAGVGWGDRKRVRRGEPMTSPLAELWSST